jgi:predicted enzyme related to lactoylglutathione lyase
MTSRVVHFEVPIDDPARAGTFYRDVFGWQVEKWGDVDYWTVTAGEAGGPGADGALKPRAEGPEGVTVYVSVDDIDASMQKIKEAGGTLLTGKMPIPTMGWSAQFRDSEGNLIGMFQHDPSVPEMPAEMSAART